MQPPPELFEHSCLVVAHPDDEILWFSSVIGRVEKVVLCFLGNPAIPERAAQRRRVLERFPLDHVRCLGIDVPVSADEIDWSHPRETSVGLHLSSKAARRRYEASFQAVRARLAEELAGCKHVFTHNPWGEYGHADHVQVHRAVQSLSAELGFRVRFSNYVAPRSVLLARRYVTGPYEPHLTLPTDPELAHRIRDLYVEESCWTAADDFIWYEEECFNSLPPAGEARPGTGRNIFPMNMLTKLKPRAKPFLRRVESSLSKRVRRLRD